MHRPSRLWNNTFGKLGLMPAADAAARLRSNRGTCTSNRSNCGKC